MKVRRFGKLLAEHQVRTAFEMGWAGLKNGELLAQAASRFDAFVTVDQNVQFQQNMKPGTTKAAGANRRERSRLVYEVEFSAPRYERTGAG